MPYAWQAICKRSRTDSQNGYTLLELYNVYIIYYDYFNILILYFYHLAANQVFEKCKKQYNFTSELCKLFLSQTNAENITVYNFILKEFLWDKIISYDGIDPAYVLNRLITVPG